MRIITIDLWLLKLKYTAFCIRTLHLSVISVMIIGIMLAILEDWHFLQLVLRNGIGLCYERPTHIKRCFIDCSLGKMEGRPKLVGSSRLSSFLQGTFLWEFPGCWNVVLARKLYICIIIVPGRLCSGDNRSVANASHFCSPGSSATWVQFTERTHSYWLNSLLLKITWGMASFYSLTLIKLSQPTRV